MSDCLTLPPRQTGEGRSSIGSRLQCNVCNAPFQASATPTVAVPCNIRKFSGESFNVWRCVRCRCIHCREVVDLDVYYAGYPSQRQGVDLISRIIFFEQLRRFRKAGMKPRHRLLDYGCGYGNFVHYLRSKGYSRAFGYDPYSPDEAISDRRLLQPGSFDYICLQEVIEHVEDPRSLLQTLAGLLRVGGVLLVGMPSADDIDLADPLKFKHHLHVPYHLHIYTKPALTDMAAEMGLHPIAWYRRFYVESPLFGMNEAFVRNYCNRIDGTVDALMEPIRVFTVLKSPILWLHGALGYFYSGNHSITGLFQKYGSAGNAMANPPRTDAPGR